MRESETRDESSRLHALERRCRRLSVAMGVIGASWIVMLLVHLSGEARAVDQAGAAGPAATLSVRELVVVDANGTPRVRIAAPLPDPIMLGKRFKRGSPVSGILIYDAEGNERGGYVTGDESRDAALTLDEINRAAVHIGVSERGEAHVMLSNGQGSSCTMGVLPDGGFLRLERDGQAVTTLPPPAAGVGR